MDIPARTSQRPEASESPRDTLMRGTLPAAPPQALCAIHTDRSTPPSCSVPLPHSLPPSGWSGECIAASAARRPADLATESGTDPQSGTRDSLPSLRPRQVHAAQSVSHPTFGSSAECTFPGPLSTSPILLSLFSALPASCQID